MIFDIKHLDVKILKKFNGINNYFNPSHFNGKTIFRKESKFENKLLVSDIVDDKNNLILQHHFDENYMWSYEDARFINENEISICCCKRDKNNLTHLINVELKKYNLTTKKFTNYKTQNTHLEKNWQFYNDKIIYHIDPYIVLNEFDESLLFKNQINWGRWTKLYGSKFGLSTNVFTVNNENYILFHSSKCRDEYIKYFVGLLKLNNDLIPIAYAQEPFFESNIEYTDNEILNDLWKWRKTELYEVWKYEIIFPMNVIIDDNNINIYSGLNDCSAVNIIIDKNLFCDKIEKSLFILT